MSILNSRAFPAVATKIQIGNQKFWTGIDISSIIYFLIWMLVERVFERWSQRHLPVTISFFCDILYLQITYQISINEKKYHFRYFSYKHSNSSFKYVWQWHLLYAEYKVAAYGRAVTYKEHATVTFILKNVVAFFARQHTQVPANKTAHTQVSWLATTLCCNI